MTFHFSSPEFEGAGSELLQAVPAFGVSGIGFEDCLEVRPLSASALGSAPTLIGVRRFPLKLYGLDRFLCRRILHRRRLFMFVWLHSNLQCP